MEQEVKNKKSYDVVIVGGGPGGLTAAIYASRANLSTVFIEKSAPGGKMVKTSTIENYSGFRKIKGPELSTKMFEHAKSFDAVYKYGNVKKIDSKGDQDKIITLENGETINGKFVIIASGMRERIPANIINLEKFDNRGLSYCAICDGPLYRGDEIGIIGGGNSAIEEGIYLSSLAKKVTIFVRKEQELIAEKKIIEQARAKSNITILLDSEVKELIGKEKLEKVRVLVKGKVKLIPLTALFPYIGFIATSEFVSHLAITDDKGFIITDNNMETKVKNIFAVGDIRVGSLRQISTAVSDGTIAGKLVGNRI